MRIFKNVRVVSGGFRKKSDSAAEDFQKSSDCELKILIKERYRLASGSTKPTNNHHKLRRSLFKSTPRAGKSPARELKILKKDRVTS
jgi:hypothetical protein